MRPTLTALGTAPPGSNEPFVGGGMGDADIVQKSNYKFRLGCRAVRRSAGVV